MGSIRTRLWRRVPVAVAMLCVGCAHCGARPEDGLEPNNDPEHATRLTLGVAVAGRANQGNPDVFSVEVTRAGTLLYRLENVGLEDCPAFTAVGPGGQVAYRDAPSHCGSTPDPAESVPGASLTPVADFGYELRVPAASAGTFFLTIEEKGQADNLFPFSWDYRVTATLE